MLKAFLPILLLLLVAVAAAVAWIVYDVAHPPGRAYLVTPEQFSILSQRGLKATNETWTNRDGTQARGWLLRGAEGAPAVVLLHHYGANRSWLLNLGVKLNETTNYTVLWPDLRAHGQDPAIKWTSFGTREAEDAVSALEYLRSLKTAQERPLVGEHFGLYGIELGAYAALQAAGREAGVRALVLDSAPASPDDLLRAVVHTHSGMDNRLLDALTRCGIRIYFLGRYENAPACATAHSLAGRRVLLLTGEEAGYLRDQTVALAQCFPDQANVEIKSDLPLTGFNLPSATGERGEAYDRRVIDFFDKALRATP